MNDLLNELEALLGKATPGPWKITGRAKNYRRAVLGSDGNEIAHNASYYDEMFGDNDTDALVALRNAAPALIARVRELETTLSEAAKNAGKGSMNGKPTWHFRCEDVEKLSALLPLPTPPQL